uniref:Uncharacterized protein n=1 Tax=Parascaris univalens TaxID=6257 RepID=A0A914ZVN3_PARUN
MRQRGSLQSKCGKKGLTVSAAPVTIRNDKRTNADEDAPSGRFNGKKGTLHSSPKMVNGKKDTLHSSPKMVNGKKDTLHSSPKMVNGKKGMLHSSPKMVNGIKGTLHALAENGGRSEEISESSPSKDSSVGRH